MASLFDTLEAEAFRRGLQARSKEAAEWFQKKARELGPLGKNVLKDERLQTVGKPIPGDMIMYTYNPKLKRQLPYYDTFPLTIVVGPAQDGFYGITLHYLPPKIRAIFLDHLSDTASNKFFNKTTKMKITYNLLKATAKYKYFKPCFKHYLTKHVSSNISKVSAAEWNIAIFLQTASFRKAGESKVWADSRSKY